MEKKHYRNIDGLRTICCLGIIAMHIRANTNYEFQGPLYNIIIPSWTQFVYLFLIISGFGMSCGYYDRFKNGNVDIESFYNKRYSKILPFFSVLIIIDLLLERNIESVYEGILELTMIFGLLPNNSLNVIGVSWTLGVIFLFYMLFPFYVYITNSKRRAWFSFIISIIISYMCNIYFFSSKFVVNDFTARHSLLYCAPFFICGGLIYLYQKDITKWNNKYNVVQLLICVSITVLYYIVEEVDGIIGLLILFSSWLIYALGKEHIIFSNRLTDYMGKISLEMYLAHMFVFRILEKLGIVQLLGNQWYSYCATFILTVVSLILFIYSYKLVVEKLKWIIERR